MEVVTTLSTPGPAAPTETGATASAVTSGQKKRKATSDEGAVEAASKTLVLMSGMKKSKKKKRTTPKPHAAEDLPKAVRVVAGGGSACFRRLE